MIDRYVIEMEDYGDDWVLQEAIVFNWLSDAVSNSNSRMWSFKPETMEDEDKLQVVWEEFDRFHTSYLAKKRQAVDFFNLFFFTFRDEKMSSDDALDLTENFSTFTKQIRFNRHRR